MMDSLTVILVQPRFPENVGMVARACANMGVARIIVVAPERWDMDKAAPLATGKGLDVLRNAAFTDTLEEALAGHTVAFGATARTGGWRQGVMPPRNAAARLAELTADGDRAALVFGSEDRGLENSDIALCTGLVTIPTVPVASSLNLAQAVLIVLYECFTASLEHAYHPNRMPRGRKQSRQASIDEQEKLFASLREALVNLDFLPGDNPDWFMQPLRRFFRRAVLRRHEYDIFMGICRHILRLTGKRLS